jgi:hypothetical protein
MNADPSELVTAIARSVIAILLVLFGAYCLVKSFGVIFSKDSLQQDPTKFEGQFFGMKFLITTGTIATIGVCVSVIWAGLGYVAAPRYDATSDGGRHVVVHVSSITSPSIETTFPISQKTSSSTLQYIAQLVTQAGPSQVSGATISIPAGQSASLASDQAKSIREDLMSSGIDQSKIRVVQLDALSDQSAPNAKVRIDFKDQAALRQFESNSTGAGH